MPADPDSPRLGTDPDDALRGLHEAVWHASPNPQAIVAVEHDPLCFRLVARNPATERWTGMPEAGTRGRLIEEIYPPELAQGLIGNLARCVQARQSIQCTVSEVMGQGAQVFSMTLTPLFDAHGRVGHVLGTAVEVTQVRRAEQAERILRERLDVVAGGADLGTWIWDVPSDRTELNERYAGMLGWRLDQIEHTGRAWAALVHPDDRARVTAQVEASLAGRTERVDYELRMRHRDGRWIWVQSRGRVVRRAPDGAPLVMAGTHLDITAQKLLQQERDEALARFATLVANVPTPLFRWRMRHDGQTETVFASARYQALLGHIGSVPDREFYARLLDAPDDKRFYRMMNRAIAERGPIEFEAEHRLPDGSRRWLRTSARFIGDDGEGLAWDGVIVDTSALHAQQAAAQAARSEAEQAGAAKARFLAAMSHEIRTPLVSVIGLASLLLDTALTDEQRAMVLQQREAGRLLLAVINDILDFSRLEAGGLALAEAPVELRALLDGCAALVAPDARAKAVGLAVEVEPSVPPWLLLDALRIRQIVVNLLANAVKFTPAGSVRLHAAPAAPGRLCLAVTDTGIGIAPERHGRLFQSFSQIDGSIAREFGGTGLGLAIVKRLAELMGGTVGFDSRPGAGSRFWVELPMRPAAAPGAPEPPAAPQAARPLRILLAEDNRINRIILERMLVRAGHRVECAADGGAALEAVERGAGFDLVLMDMQMPGLDGIAATRRIRALPGPRGRVPVVALTANALDADAARCLAAGMDGHLPKPIEPEALLAAVARYGRGSANVPT